MERKNLTIEQLHNRNNQPVNDGVFRGTTTYTVNGKDYEVAQYNHPTLLANKILAWLEHTYFFALSVIGPPGHGKTSVAQCVIHRLHTVYPDFKVVHAGEYEFTHQKEFYQSLPKYPHIIFYDDVSGAMGSLSEKEIELQFQALSTVRWILDPAFGKIPVVIILGFHYSKKVEKSIRSQLSMNIFCALGQEERTNLDTIAERGSPAWITLKHYGYLYTKMFEDHEFSLQMPTGKITYKTDDPFRVVAAITRTNAYLILYSHKDVCDYCAEKKVQKFVEPDFIYNMIKTAYGRFGLQSLRHALYKRGYKEAIHPVAANASDFLEEKVFSQYETDYKGLIKMIYHEAHQKVPERRYRKRKQEKELSYDLEDESIEIPITDPNTEPVQNTENNINEDA